MAKIHVTYSDSRGETIETDVTEDVVNKITQLLSPSQEQTAEEKRLEFNRKQRERYKKAKENPNVINAHIYVLKFGNNTYIGSTILSLSTRLINHLCLARKYNDEKKLDKFYNTLYQFDRDAVSIKSLCFHRTISKIELKFKEDYYIATMKPNMNTRGAVNERLKKKYPQYIVKEEEDTTQNTL